MATEVIDTVTGEVIEEKMLAVVKPSINSLVKEQDLPFLHVIESLSTLDWKRLPPPAAALLLMAKPFTVSGGGTMHLTLRQALIFAVRAHELGLSPFSDNLWFDPAKCNVSITMSGKRELARLRNIEMGPPVFEDLTRPWENVPKITTAGEEAKKAGFKSDVGVKCTIRVGAVTNAEHVSFTAWLNDWYVSRSPVWKEKYAHMLAIRSNEKALTLILGAGASQMPDEKELE